MAVRPVLLGLLLLARAPAAARRQASADARHRRNRGPHRGPRLRRGVVAVQALRSLGHEGVQELRSALRNLTQEHHPRLLQRPERALGAREELARPGRALVLLAGLLLERCRALGRLHQVRRNGLLPVALWERTHCGGRRRVQNRQRGRWTAWRPRHRCAAPQGDHPRRDAPVGARIVHARRGASGPRAQHGLELLSGALRRRSQLVGLGHALLHLGLRGDLHVASLPLELLNGLALQSLHLRPLPPQDVVDGLPRVLLLGVLRDLAVQKVHAQPLLLDHLLPLLDLLHEPPDLSPLGVQHHPEVRVRSRRDLGPELLEPPVDLAGELGVALGVRVLLPRRAALARLGLQVVLHYLLLGIHPLIRLSGAPLGELR
mmetsp:Transcript_44800/g.120729  ORF Transcript_44800/g.120729 Transcript_44800/m.120729 type:complete len:375 (-) Transcript_44800:617-1741(-)